ncbi:TPA: hypothetical protein DEB00_03655 [Candidatus Uhrbacteria bacterium]|nr:hypothetical protein [Candidatus Uhrbacteria bacterium]
MVIVLGGAYVMQVSQSTQHGYTMRDLEDSVQELQVTNERLTTAVASATSLGTVAERMQILGFVDSREVVYLTGVNSVAVR